ncbi:MAG TPA: hypothetical protein VM325_00950 [Alphaproteobacteria bacterium]|nr:hypothetical protein [Alphaproteobacteria bacterium]
MPKASAMNAIATHNRLLKRRDREETARLLVLARGYHGAIDTCLRNGWEEILALLLPRGNSGAVGAR